VRKLLATLGGLGGVQRPLALLGGLGLAALTGACGDVALREERAADPRLNVVLLTLDTVRADALGAYGQPLPATPRIDAAAEEGLLFEQTLASSPSTLPSHASLLTGQQPYVHGVRSNAGYVLSDESVTLAEVLRSHGWTTGAEIAASVLGSFQRLDQGFDVYRDPLQDDAAVDVTTPKLRHALDVTHHGLSFLRDNRYEPFFLWLHYYDAHAPFTPPPRYRKLLPDDPYLGEVRLVDQQVGRILREIEELGLREQTLAVITSDHGEGLDEHDEETHAFFVYDTTMRVPLVFWGAEAVPRGRRVAAPVRLVDVAPTLLDLLGLPPLAGVQGVSLRPFFEDAGATLALTGYGESLAPLSIFGGDPLRFVREGRWKYIHKLEPEIYDVEADPAELRNLAEQEPERIAALRLRLGELLAAAPAGPAAVEKRPSPETLAQLRALGYLSGRAPEASRGESLELRGPDPNSKSADLRQANRAWSHAQAGNPAAAVADFRAVWSRNPGSVAVLEGLVAALARSEHDPRELESLLRRGLEIDPESTSFRILLALALQQRGEIVGAEVLLREALAIDRCVVEARVQLKALLAQRGDDAGVEEMVRGAAPCPKTEAARRALAGDWGAGR